MVNRYSLKKILIFAFLAALPLGAAEVITYKVSESERAVSSYKVFVNGREVGLYRALSPLFSRGEYFFAYFDFEGDVNIEVKSSVPFTKHVPYTASKEEKEAAAKQIVAEVFPRSINAKIEPKKISFSARGPFKAIVLRNERELPLVIFGNALEKNPPKQGGANVLYYGAGVHYSQKPILVGDNQTLYLAGGAVLKAPVYCSGKNIKLCGRGIISQDNREFGPLSVKCHECENLTVEDIIIKDSCGWTFAMFNCDGVLVDNLKICSSRMLNDDAIDICNSSNVVVKNTFARAQDDIIAIKGIYGSGKRLGRNITKDPLDRNNNLPVENIEIADCIFWSDHANIFRIGYECEAPYFKNIRIKNIKIPYFSMFYREPAEYWSHAVVWLQPTNGMRIEGVHFDGMEIRSNGGDMIMLMAQPRVVKYAGMKIPGSIENCSIKNVEIYGKKGKFKGMFYIEGRGEAYSVKNLEISNLTKFGEKATSQTQKHFIGNFTENIKFLENK